MVWSKIENMESRAYVEKRLKSCKISHLMFFIWQSFLRNERENAVLAVIQETKKNVSTLFLGRKDIFPFYSQVL